MIVFRRFVRDRRRSAVGWSIGLAVYILSQNAFYPSFKEQPGFAELFENMPEAMKSLFGISDMVPLTSPPGWIQSQVFSLLPVLMAIFAISLGTRALATSEEDGTLELLLSNPVPRWRVAAERLAGLVVLSMVVGLAASIVTLATAPVLQLIEGVSIPGFFAASWGAVAVALLFGALAFGVGGLTGRRSLAIGIPAILAVGTYMINGLASSVEAAHPLRLLSPFHWYLGRNMLAQGVAIEAMLLPAGFAAAFAAMGLWGFLRRDIRTS